MKTIKEKMDFVKGFASTFSVLIRCCNAILVCIVVSVAKATTQCCILLATNGNLVPMGLVSNKRMKDNVATEVSSSGDSASINVSLCDKSLLEQRTFCVSNSALIDREPRPTLVNENIPITNHPALWAGVMQIMI